MKNQIFCLSLLALCPHAAAEVDLQDASFILHQNDFQTPLLARTYNSRSLWQGVFGFGWCAEFEKSLNPNTGIVRHCDQEETGKAKAQGTNWVVKQAHRIEVYNFRGQLMQIKDSRGSFWDLSYDRQGRLSRIQGSRARFDFHYLDFHLSKIESFPNRREPSVQFRFLQNLMIESRSSRHFSKYTYDELQNLTLIEESKKKSIRVSYDSRLDQVRQVTIGNCSQDFQFKKISDRKFASRATTHCSFSRSRAITYLFTAHPTPSGLWKLRGAQITEDTNDPLSLP
jgi:YD repeat-containing protein